MSDTPRSDKLIDADYWTLMEHARQLERELNEARKELKEERQQGRILLKGIVQAWEEHEGNDPMFHEWMDLLKEAIAEEEKHE